MFSRIRRWFTAGERPAAAPVESPPATPAGPEGAAPDEDAAGLWREAARSVVSDETSEDEDSPERVEGMRVALEHSLRWRVKVLLEGSELLGPLEDGPALVEALQSANQEAVRQIPFAAQQALVVARSPNSCMADLVGLFERDPTLTQSLLKTANSSWYAQTHEPVVSILHAVQRIGYQGVENVLMASIVEGMLCRPGGAYTALVGKVWSHMLRTAPLARRMASAFGVDPESAYTLALLHDVGKLAVFDNISALRKTLHREVRMPETFLFLLLNHLHEPIGGQAALRWGLGTVTARALARHHRHPKPRRPDPLTELIYVAERVDIETVVRHEPLDLPAIWARGGITTEIERVVPFFEEAQDKAA